MDFTATTTFIGTGLGFGGAVLALFWKSEEVASPAAKTAIANWLRGLDLGEALERWPTAFIHIFDRLFGERHFSLACFLRSCIASIISVVLMAFVFVSLRGYEAIFAGLFSKDSLAEVIEIFLLLALGVNLLVDYVSLLETRYLLNIIARQKSALITAALLLLDLVLTIGIYFVFGVVILTAWEALFADGEMLAKLLTEPGGWLKEWFEVLVELFKFEGWIGKYGTCLYSTFFTSLWLWLFVAARWLVRLAVPLKAGLKLGKWFLDIEGHPLRSLGIGAGGLACFGYWLIIGLAKAAEAAAP